MFTLYNITKVPSKKLFKQTCMIYNISNSHANYRHRDSGVKWTENNPKNTGNDWCDPKHLTQYMMNQTACAFDKAQTLHQQGYNPLSRTGRPFNLPSAPAACLHTQTCKSLLKDGDFETKSGSVLQRRLLNFSTEKLLEKAPKQYHLYLKLIRFDKPIGTWLLLLPCTWSISLAATPGHLPDLHMLALFSLGAFLMRGAGCIINDMWDKDIDSRVWRTKNRPMASGKITHFKALQYLAFNLSASLCILLHFNWYSVFLGMASIPLVAVYPYMKRITFWPQMVLGLTFNWGCLLGWAAVNGACYWPVVLPLYASGIAWTLFYDTIYAHQDKKDDMLIGVKSTALLFGDKTKQWLTGFGSVMVSGLTLVGVVNHEPLLYFLGIGGVAAHLYWQVSTVKLNKEEDCWSKFRSNRNLGLFIFATIVASNLLKDSKKETAAVSEK